MARAPSLLRLLKKVDGEDLKSLATKDGVKSRLLARPLVSLQEQAVAEINCIEDIIQVVRVRREILDARFEVNEFLRRLRHRRIRLSKRLGIPVKRTKEERLGHKICRLIKFAANAAEDRIRTAKRMVLSRKEHLEVAIDARTDFGFNGKLFLSKKLGVFDAYEMVIKAMYVYGIPVEQLRKSTQLGITISEAGATIHREFEILHSRRRRRRR